MSTSSTVLPDADPFIQIFNQRIDEEFDNPPLTDLSHAMGSCNGVKSAFDFIGIIRYSPFMSRPLRITYPGAWYHVMNRGRRKENIFFNEDDYLLFLEVMKETIKMWNLEVSAYCLMSNHYHLLVRTPEANLSRCMRHLNGVYTQRFNQKHNIDGQLFRGRYKSILVEDDGHLMELLRYIHRNPIKAEITTRLENYPWSSHKAYLAKSKGWNWLQNSLLLEMFSKSRKLAYPAYLDFVNQSDSVEVATFFSKKTLPSIFGSLEFIEKIKNNFQHLSKLREIPEADILTVTFESVQQTVCQVCNVTPESLRKSRRGERNLPRDLVLYAMRQHSRQTLHQIGRHLNVDNYSSVSSAVQRIKRDLEKDKSMQSLMHKIELLLSKSQKQT